MAFSKDQSHPETQFIVINRVSSVGNSPVAKAIQRLAEKPFLHVQLDGFLTWQPRSKYISAKIFQSCLWTDYKSLQVEAALRQSPMSGHVRGRCAIQKAERRRYLASGSFLPICNRPRSDHSLILFPDLKSADLKPLICRADRRRKTRAHSRPDQLRERTERDLPSRCLAVRFPWQPPLEREQRLFRCH